MPESENLDAGADQRIIMLQNENQCLKNRIDELLAKIPHTHTHTHTHTQIASSPTLSIGTNAAPSEASTALTHSTTNTLDVVSSLRRNNIFGCRVPNASLTNTIVSVDGPAAPGEEPSERTKRRRQLQTRQLVGKGTFGEVYLTKHNGVKCALKVVKESSGHCNREEETVKMLMRERPDNIVPVYACERASTTDELHIYMLYVPKTLRIVLLQLKESNPHMKQHVHRVVFAQLARALEFLHGRGVAHRDLKPENVLVHQGHLKIYLCDFGSAKRIEAEPARRPPSETYMCTRFYRAPELIIDRNQYGVGIDVWAFGCIFIEACIGRILFAEANNLEMLVRQIRLLGTINQDDIDGMLTRVRGGDGDLEACPNFVQHQSRWDRLFGQRTFGRAFESLCQQMLCFHPRKRLGIGAVAASDYLGEVYAALPEHEDSPASLVKRLNAAAAGAPD